MNGGVIKTNENGELVLSFGQATWMTSMVVALVGLIITVLGVWYDMRNRMDVAIALLERRITVMESSQTYSRGEIDVWRANRDKEMARLDARLDRLEVWRRERN